MVVGGDVWMGQSVGWFGLKALPICSTLSQISFGIFLNLEAGTFSFALLGSELVRRSSTMILTDVSGLSSQIFGSRDSFLTPVTEKKLVFIWPPKRVSRWATYNDWRNSAGRCLPQDPHVRVWLVDRAMNVQQDGVVRSADCCRVYIRCIWIVQFGKLCWKEERKSDKERLCIWANVVILYLLILGADVFFIILENEIN